MTCPHIVPHFVVFRLICCLKLHSVMNSSAVFKHSRSSLCITSHLGIQQNLHIVLIMDCSNSNFTINCESNPAFYRKCSVQWMEGWSESSMKKVRGE